MLGPIIQKVYWGEGKLDEMESEKRYHKINEAPSFMHYFQTLSKNKNKILSFQINKKESNGRSQL
jgi:hypothetical protein